MFPNYFKELNQRHAIVEPDLVTCHKWTPNLGGASLGVDQGIVTKNICFFKKEIGLHDHKNVINPYLIASIVGRAYVTKLWLLECHL